MTIFLAFLAGAAFGCAALIAVVAFASDEP